MGERAIFWDIDSRIDFDFPELLGEPEPLI